MVAITVLGYRLMQAFSFSDTLIQGDLKWVHGYLKVLTPQEQTRRQKDNGVAAEEDGNLVYMVEKPETRTDRSLTDPQACRVHVIVIYSLFIVVNENIVAPKYRNITIFILKRTVLILIKAYWMDVRRNVKYKCGSRCFINVMHTDFFKKGSA